MTVSGVRRLYVCESKLLNSNGINTGLVIKSEIFARNRAEAKISFVETCKSNNVSILENGVAVRSADEVPKRYPAPSRV